MTRKKYTVHFHHTSVGGNGEPLHGRLLRLHAQHGEHLPRWNIGEGEFLQIRNLRRVGRVWMGDFARLRDDAPHLVADDDSETPLDLSGGQRVLEKSHFLYRSADDVFVWQKVRGVAGQSAMQTYLTDLLREPTLLPLVMNDAELERILQRDLYELSFEYARPAHRPDNAPRWNQGAFDVMAGVHAALGKFTLRAHRGHSLAENAKAAVRRLVGDASVSKVRVKLTDEMKVVDLFMAPLKGEIHVQLVGRYAAPAEVFQGLEEQYDHHRHSIPPR